MKICACGRAADLNDTSCRRCIALQNLGLGPSPSEIEIKDAHRLNVKAWHPDRFPGDEREKHAAQEKLKLINEAHQFLTSSSGQKSPDDRAADPIADPLGSDGQAQATGQPRKPVTLRQAIRELGWWRYALFLVPVLTWVSIEFVTSHSRASSAHSGRLGAFSAQPGSSANSNTASDPSPADTLAEEQKAEAFYKQKRYPEARLVFENSCNLGQMKGCNYLGYMFATGLGGERNLNMAGKIYQKACTERVLTSCASLGSLYQDAGYTRTARIYFNTACDGGLTAACALAKKAD